MKKRDSSVRKIKTEYGELGGRMHYLAHSMSELCQGREQGMQVGRAIQCMIVLEKKLYL